MAQPFLINHLLRTYTNRPGIHKKYDYTRNLSMVGLMTLIGILTRDNAKDKSSPELLALRLVLSILTHFTLLTAIITLLSSDCDR